MMCLVCHSLEECAHFGDSQQPQEALTQVVYVCKYCDESYTYKPDFCHDCGMSDKIWHPYYSEEYLEKIQEDTMNHGEWDYTFNEHLLSIEEFHYRVYYGKIHFVLIGIAFSQ